MIICFPRSVCEAALLVLCFSAERSAEFTEVPLGALDIAAADSLTLSPAAGEFTTVRLITE